MANRVVNLFVRIGDGRARVVTNENIPINPASNPVIHYSEILEVHLRPLHEDGTPWSLAEITPAFSTYKFGLDEDFNRSTTPWVFTDSDDASWSQANYINLIGDPLFTGSGLNDTISGGTFTGTDTTYTIKIDSAGGTDTFQWREVTGVTVSAWTTGVVITSSAQTLDDGVQITFNAITGHTVNDTWTINATAAGELICDADAFNTQYNSQISTRESVEGNAEWQFLNGTDVDLLIQIPWILKASLIDPGDSPPTPTTQYVLKSNNPPIFATDPTGGDLREGLFWWNSTDNKLRFYDGTEVMDVGFTPTRQA